MGAMPSPVQRREILQASGALTIGALAGCSYLQDDSRSTSIRVRNYHSQDLYIGFGVLDPDPDEEDNSHLFHKFIELDAITEEGDLDSEIVEDAFESQKALLRLDIGVQGEPDLVREFTYFPGNNACSQEAVKEYGHRLDIDFNPDIQRMEVVCGPTE